MRTRARARMSTNSEEGSHDQLNSVNSTPPSAFNSITVDLATVISRCHFTLYRIQTDQEAHPISSLTSPADSSSPSSSSSSPSSRSNRTQVQVIKQHLSFLADLKSDLNAEQVEAVRKVIQISKEAADAVAAEHRETHAYISRLGKSIDKCFSTKTSEAITQTETFVTYRNQMLHEVAILHYLIKSGYDDIALALVRETGIQDVQIHNGLMELCDILRSLRLYDPQPAFDWVLKQNDMEEYSDILFKLHKVMFRHVALSEGDQAAVEYAQEHFPPYAEFYRTDITEIMCSLVNDDRTLPPTYTWTRKDLELWRSVKEAVLQGMCKFLKLPLKCHLRNIVDIGCKILPRILEIQDIMARTNMPPLWHTNGELPVECVNFFHSSLICPILRQECTEENPPVRLKCGHVISKIAMERLCNTRSSSLKCPYCPVYSEISSVKRIYV